MAATVTPELVNFCTSDKDSEVLSIFTSIRLSPRPFVGMFDRVLSRMAMEKASGVPPGLVVSSASKPILVVGAEKLWKNSLKKDALSVNVTVELREPVAPPDKFAEPVGAPPVKMKLLRVTVFPTVPIN